MKNFGSGSKEFETIRKTILKLNIESRYFEHLQAKMIEIWQKELQKSKNLDCGILKGNQKNEKAMLVLDRFCYCVVSFCCLVAGKTEETQPMIPFSKAKKVFLRQVYRDHRVAFYCGCPFNVKKQILPCDNYRSKKEGKRAHRLEWEHIVPAHAFGQSFPEWEMATLNVLLEKENPLKAGTVPGKCPMNFVIWNLAFRDVSGD
jgi:hypothetical protein